MGTSGDLRTVVRSMGRDHSCREASRAFDGVAVMTALAFALGALLGTVAGYVMARPRKVRPTSSEALASYARQSGENAARAVS